MSGLNRTAATRGDKLAGFRLGNREMNFREVAATILAAIVIGVASWATIGPPPREEHFSMVSKRQFERAFEP